MASETIHFARPPSYPMDGTYADLLFWHLFVWGTRPGGSVTERGTSRWTEKEFRAKIFEGRSTPESEPKIYKSWIGRGRPFSAPGPDYAPCIAKELFNGEAQYEVWENDLKEAQERSTSGRNIKSITLESALVQLSGTRSTDDLTGGIDNYKVEIERSAEASDGFANSSPTILALQGEASVQSDGLSAEVQKISQDVNKILLILRGSDMLQRAAQAGLGEEDIAEALTSSDRTAVSDGAQAEEIVLLHLLQSNFAYQREFAWDSLLYLDVISPAAVDAMVSKALSYDKPHQANAIREIFRSSAQGIDQAAIAESLASHRSEEIRKLAIKLLVKRDAKARIYAQLALADQSAPVRLVGVQYFERKLGSAPDVIPEFCRLLSDSDVAVCTTAARGLLSLCIDKGWEHLPSDSRASLADAIAKDRNMWTMIVTALSKDGAPISAFQHLLSIIYSVTDRNMRKHILNTVPGERERHVADKILQLSSTDDQRIIQAAYMLAHFGHLGTTEILALSEAVQRSTSGVVRSAISMAIKAQDGREIPRACQLASDDIDQSDIYPLWKCVVIIENVRGIDIREVSKIISYCEKFEADFYIWNESVSDDRFLVCPYNVLDIYALCFCKGSEMSMGASGPEAIEGVNSLARYVSTSLY